MTSKMQFRLSVQELRLFSSVICALVLAGCLDNAYQSKERLFSAQFSTVIPDAIFFPIDKEQPDQLDVGRIGLQRILETDYYEVITTKAGSLFEKRGVVFFIRAVDVAPDLPADAYFVGHPRYEAEDDRLVKTYTYWPVLLENRRTLSVYPFVPEVYSQLFTLAACPFLRTKRNQDEELRFFIAEASKPSRLQDAFGGGTLRGFVQADPKVRDINDITQAINYQGRILPHPGQTTRAGLTHLLADCQEAANDQARVKAQSLSGTKASNADVVAQNLLHFLRVVDRLRNGNRNIYQTITDQHVSVGLPLRFSMRRYTFDKRFYNLNANVCREALAVKVTDSAHSSAQRFVKQVANQYGNMLPYLRIACDAMRTLYFVSEEKQPKLRLKLVRSSTGWNASWVNLAQQKKPNVKKQPDYTSSGAQNRTTPSVTKIIPKPKRIAQAIDQMINQGGYLNAEEMERIVAKGYAFQCSSFSANSNSCGAVTQYLSWKPSHEGTARFVVKGQRNYNLVVSYAFYTYRGFVCFAPKRAHVGFSPQLPASILAAKLDLAQSHLRNTDGNECVGIRNSNGKLEQVHIASKRGKLRTRREPVAYFNAWPRLRQAPR